MVIKGVPALRARCSTDLRIHYHTSPEAGEQIRHLPRGRTRPSNSGTLFIIVDTHLTSLVIVAKGHD